MSFHCDVSILCATHPGLSQSPTIRNPICRCVAVEKSPPIPLLIAHNASSDGSEPFLRAYAQRRPGVEFILHNDVKWHGLWIDLALRQAPGELLFVLDSDLIFFGHSLFARCQRYMQDHPECWILQADSWESRRDTRHNSDERLYDEALSTWFLCIRTGLHERIDASFEAVFPAQQPARDGREVMSDTGARVIEAMRQQGLEIHALPRPWRWQFHHVGSLSWLPWAGDQQNRWMRLKQAKLRLLERWGRRLWPCLP